MDKVVENIKVKLSDFYNGKEIIVDDVYFYKKDKYEFLTIVLDKIGGIDLDTIVDASNEVNEIIDKMDIPSENYILDVISKERG